MNEKLEDLQKTHPEIYKYISYLERQCALSAFNPLIDAPNLVPQDQHKIEEPHEMPNLEEVEDIASIFNKRFFEARDDLFKM